MTHMMRRVSPKRLARVSRGKDMKKQSNKKRATNSAPREEGIKTITHKNGPTVEDRIRLRAHEIHLARGGAPGKDLEDWLQAEHEIKAEMDQA
jgi:DUF2934 family protein